MKSRALWGKLLFSHRDQSSTNPFKHSEVFEICLTANILPLRSASPVSTRNAHGCSNFHSKRLKRRGALRLPTGKNTLDSNTAFCGTNSIELGDGARTYVGRESKYAKVDPLNQLILEGTRLSIEIKGLPGHGGNTTEVDGSPFSFVRQLPSSTSLRSRSVSDSLI